MTVPSQSDSLVIGRIRAGEAGAWAELIARFEGRLLAFVESRAGNRSTAEDLVQETFIGFLTSLPNFDARRPLESYLFSIAAHKLTDHLRREGRRPPPGPRNRRPGLRPPRQNPSPPRRPPLPARTIPAAIRRRSRGRPPAGWPPPGWIGNTSADTRKSPWPPLTSRPSRPLWRCRQLRLWDIVRSEAWRR